MRSRPPGVLELESNTLVLALKKETEVGAKNSGNRAGLLHQHSIYTRQCSY
jgi:hypothetical protein